ncbi:MAG: hypothetical protein F4X58_13345 [Chloroflexi bacterium]|nr:hypothetical protein [Chloroflexota bacterium]MYC02891.1 hypothetical protein [Chloroflexota bacterium]
MTEQTNRPRFTPGFALMPEDFPARLTALKQQTGLSWEGMATVMGVDSRQLQRWRRGSVSSGAAMLALVRLATQVPDGLSELLDDDQLVIRRKQR